MRAADGPQLEPGKTARASQARSWLVSQALIEVEDNGPGLGSGELPGSCGLGLAIGNQIARLHGGTATVLGLQPHGLRVRLGLPLAS